MKWFLNLKTRVKLLVGFGAMLFLVGFLAISAQRDIRNLNGYLNGMHDNFVGRTASVAELNLHAQAARTALVAYVETEDPAKRNKLERTIAENTESIDEILGRSEEKQADGRVAEGHRNDSGALGQRVLDS